MMWWYNGSGWGTWVLMTLGMVAFWVAVVWVIGLLVRSTTGDRPRSRRALDVLDERFAQGELDAEEYEQRRQILQAGRSGRSVGTRHVTPSGRR